MSEFIIKHQKKGLRPLFMHEDYLLAAKGSAIYRCSFDLKQQEFIVQLPSASFRHYLGSYFRIFNRIFRASPTKAQQVGEHQFIIFRRSQIWFVDVSRRVANLECIIPDGRTALDCVSLDFANFSSMHVFGEYFDNPLRNPVSIWGRSHDSSAWRVLFTFQANTIDHIHAIVPDYKRKVVWILTGDFGHAAGIWISNPDFTDVQPVLRNNQMYRAAWLVDIDGRLIYATDSQFEENGVYELSNINGNWMSSKLTSVDASSIYSAKGVGANYFSTSIEPGQLSGVLLKDLLDRKPGPGIKSNFSKIYSVDSNALIHEIFSAKKDWIPPRLGQFGCFIFPSGIMPEDCIVAYGIAVEKFDDVCIVLERQIVDTRVTT
jgi:hypothetical protein